MALIKGVSRVIRTGMRIEGKHLLPGEDATVIANNNRLTQDLAIAVQCDLVKEQACRNIMSRKGLRDK